jgi:hypothetical protein
MRGDTTKTSALTVEQREYLLQIWTNITHTLVSTGHAANLFQALNIACSTLHVDQVCDDHAQNYLADPLADVSAAGIRRLELSRSTAPISDAPFGIQRPKLHSPKEEETSCHLTVPVDSTIVNGTVSSFTANNEHITLTLTPMQPPGGVAIIPALHVDLGPVV